MWRILKIIIFSNYIEKKMKSEEFKKKYNKLKKQLKADGKLPEDKNQKYYISVKDKSIYVREQETHNDRFSKDIQKTIKDWGEKGYTEYDGKLKDIPTKIYLRYITTDEKGNLLARNGGVVLANNTDEKFFMLFGNGKRWSLQYNNIKQLFVNPEQIKKQREKQPKKIKIEADTETDTDDDEEEEPEPEQKVEPEKPKKITTEEVDKLLSKIYYDEQQFKGRDSLYKIAKERNPTISRIQVEKWLKSQEVYQLTKPSKARTTFTPIVSQAPFNVVQIDLFSYGDMIFLNAIDIFSKYAQSVLVKNKTATTIVNGLKRILKKLPQKPKLIQSDNGSEFKNEKMKSFLEKEGIKQLFSTPYTPQSQGSVERFNGTMKRHLEKVSLQNININQTVVNQFIKNYNNTEHSTTKVKPNDALSEDNKEKILKAISKSRGIVSNPDDLEVGDNVRVSTKTNAKIEKPTLNFTEEVFTITKILRPKTDLKPIRYKLKGADGEEVKGYFYREELQKIDKVENKGKTAVKYEAEKIVGRRSVKDSKGNIIRRQYKIKWKGYTTKDNTWENEKQLREDGLGKMIDTFDKSFDKKERRE